MKSQYSGPGERVIMGAVSCLLVLGLTVFVSGCGLGSGVGDGGAVSTQSTEVAVDTTSPETSTTETSEATTQTTEGSGGTASSTSTSDATQSTSSTTATTASAGTVKLNVYFARGEKMAVVERTVSKTQASGATAMKALLQGPTAAEKNAGMSSSIPKGTAFLGLTIKSGVATVDLTKEYSSGGGSLSMSTRLAQVVFTLTQFPTVKGVEFKLDGKPIDVLGGEGLIIDHPMTRADYEDLSPAILVESPGLGATVKSPVRLTGTANVFEAVFRVNIVDDDGLIIADERVTATSGTGTRGTFDVSLRYPSGHAGRGSLIVFEESAKDGSHINVVEIPITLK